MVITVTLNPTVDKILEVPGFRVGLHARATLVGLLPNGKGNNVARGLARLGGDVSAYGFVGRYQEPLFIRSLEAEGVRVRFCPVDGQTRTNTTVLDPVARTSTHLRERGFEVSRADLNELETLLTDRLRQMQDSTTVVFSGSLPPGMGPDDFAALLEACTTQRAQIVADLNGPALRTAVDTGVVDTLKPNLEELGECLGTIVQHEEALEAAATLLGRVRTILLTLGGEGAFLLRRDLTLGLRCPLVGTELVNTVGCGDGFLAGWLRGSELTEDPAEALRWAVATGAASAMSELTVGYSRQDVEALLPRCESIPSR